MTEPELIPISAGTAMSLCKSCKAPIYWSITKLGRNVPVSLSDPRSKAPTRYEQGIGINHFVDCTSRDEHRRKV